MKSFILILLLLLCGCSTERHLYDFEELETNLQNLETADQEKVQTAPKPKLPPVWRGRKLFTTPWAYIYAKDKESAAYAYDELEKQAGNSQKTNGYGIIIVTCSQDDEPAFEYEKITKLYEKFLNNEELIEEVRVIFEEDLNNLKKVKKFHDGMYKKADEKKDENELTKFRKSIDHIITYATFFIQPEIMQEHMEIPIDDSIYWCAFIPLDDSMDEKLDDIITAIMDDYDVSTISRGLVWGFISPGFYFRKRAVIKESQKFFEDGYKKNALLKDGVVKFSDKPVNDHSPAGVKGSE